MTEKTVNYTEAQTVELVEAYTEAQTDEARKDVVVEFAENFGKSTASIRAKLVAKGVYVKAERATKRVAKKADLVAEIAELLNSDEDVVGSLEKATAVALTRVRDALKA